MLAFVPNTPFHTLVQVAHQLFLLHVHHLLAHRAAPSHRHTRTDQVRVLVDRRLIHLAHQRPEPHPRRQPHAPPLEVLQRLHAVRHAQSRRVVLHTPRVCRGASIHFPLQCLHGIRVLSFVPTDLLNQLLARRNKTLCMTSLWHGYK